MGNIGGATGRTSRVVAGMVLIAMVFVGPHDQMVWVGIIPLASALTGWCPACQLYGTHTGKAGQA